MTKVLIVDDDPIFQSLVAEFLTALAPLDIVATDDARTVINVASEAGSSLALIILDLNMPDCDGIELLQELGARGCSAPLLIVSGAHAAVLRSAEIIAGAIGLTVIGTMSKPIQTDEFTHLVAGVLTAASRPPLSAMAAA